MRSAIERAEPAGANAGGGDLSGPSELRGAEPISRSEALQKAINQGSCYLAVRPHFRRQVVLQSFLKAAVLVVLTGLITCSDFASWQCQNYPV